MRISSRVRYRTRERYGPGDLDLAKFLALQPGKQTEHSVKIERIYHFTLPLKLIFRARHNRFMVVVSKHPVDRKRTTEIQSITGILYLYEVDAECATDPRI